jgi:hypothetical protein
VKLLKLAKENSKKEFEIQVTRQIRLAIECKDDFAKLEYGKDNAVIKKILLYHNVYTLLSNVNELSRFPFHTYKDLSWDIEHIHASATQMPEVKTHRIDWMKAALEFIGDDSLKNSFTYFHELFLEVLNDKTIAGGEKYEVINDISNLALLDSGTNRGFKNAVFPAKRKEIIRRESTGTFIPICTRNVFMKFYSQDGVKMMQWTEDDRKAYIGNIRQSLFPETITNEQSSI